MPQQHPFLVGEEIVVLTLVEVVEVEVEEVDVVEVEVVEVVEVEVVEVEVNDPVSVIGLFRVTEGDVDAPV